MTKTKAILFDFDGTLGDTLEGIMETCKATKEKSGFDFSLKEAQTLIGKPLIEMGNILVGEENALAFVTTYLALFPEIGGKKVRFFQGIASLLEALRNDGLFCAVVTSKRLSSLQENLATVKGADYFDLLVASDATIRHKPHPAPIEYALEHLGVEKEEAIMVGDTEYDLLAAEGAGVRSVAVTWGITPKTELLKYRPTEIATSVPNLKELLLCKMR